MSKVGQERKSFTDAHIKMHKNKPAVGHYKNIDKGLKMSGRELLSTARDNNGGPAAQ